MEEKMDKTNLKENKYCTNILCPIFMKFKRNYYLFFYVI